MDANGARAVAIDGGVEEEVMGQGDGGELRRVGREGKEGRGRGERDRLLEGRRQSDRHAPPHGGRAASDAAVKEAGAAGGGGGGAGVKGQEGGR